MSMAKQYDIGRYIKAESALAAHILSATTADGDAISGVTIDRLALPRHFQSCRSVVTGRFVGSTTKTATLGTLNFQHSSDGTSWDNFSTDTVPSNKTLGSTGATGAQDTQGVIEQRVNLRAARRYVRQQVTPDLSCTSSGEMLTVAGVLVFGGADELPSS